MPPTVKAIPEGYEGATPYLIIKGATGALDFYKKAFGAKDVLRIPGRAERSATPKSALATRRGGSRCICMSRCFASTRSSSAPSRQTPRWDRIGNVQGTLWSLLAHRQPRRERPASRAREARPEDDGTPGWIAYSGDCRGRKKR